MQTKIVTRGNVIATVRSAYRRTPILEAQYMAALRSAYPELAEYEVQSATLEPPRLTTTKVADMTEDDRQKWSAYLLKATHVNRRFALGKEYWTIATSIVPALARLSAIVNGPFAVDEGGRMQAAEVVKAFEAYAEEDDPEDSLWSDLVRAINELDAPLTPAPQQPAEALTAEQKNDPLSASSTPAGTTKLAAISTT